METKKKLTLQALLKSPIFYPNEIDSFVSMKDGHHYTILEDNQLNKYDYESGNKLETLFNGFDHGIRVSDYSFNATETHILLQTKKTKIYRRSFLAEHLIYDLASKELIPLSETGKQQCATFSPDGQKIAFVRTNNIYVYELDTKKEYPITLDGQPTRIINGHTDWVYEEELEYTRAYEWSPDSKNICYIKFDETQVCKYTLQKYQGMCPSYPKNEMYPSNTIYKYPKAGEKNSIVTVHSYNFETSKTTQFDLGPETDFYITRICFATNPNNLIVFHLDRKQRCLHLISFHLMTGKSRVIFEETNKYYIDEKCYQQLKFIEDGKRFIYQSEETGYNHLYSYEMPDDNTEITDFSASKRQITFGDFDVKSFLGYDEKRKIYYYSSYEDSPIDLTIYCIDDQKNKMKITPSLGVNSFISSSNFDFIIITNSTASTVPTSILYKNEIERLDGQTNLREIKVLESNQKLQDRLDTFDYIAKKEFINLPASDGTTLLDAYIMKPRDFNETNSEKKYPLCVFMYGGPNHKYVDNSFEISWQNFLVHEGFVVLGIDPRGTAGHGEAFRKCTYLKLGQIESNDVIYATRELVNQYRDKISAKDVGIFGWSFGGFMSLLCLAKGGDVFSTAIAIAPVTNWKYYDTIYTERYMLTPQENEGYEEGAPLHLAHQISEDAHLLICHGLCDDNVHFQNTAELTEVLVQNDIQFDMCTYTNRNHGIYGGNTRYHLMTKCCRFLKNHLKHE